MAVFIEKGFSRCGGRGKAPQTADFLCRAAALGTKPNGILLPLRRGDDAKGLSARPFALPLFLLVRSCPAPKFAVGQDGIKQSLYRNLRFGAPGGLFGGVGVKKNLFPLRRGRNAPRGGEGRGCRPGETMQRGLTFSLRLGHAAALTVPRTVIHSRRAAALPSPHLSSADWFDRVLRRNSRLGRME